MMNLFKMSTFLTVALTHGDQERFTESNSQKTVDLVLSVQPFHTKGRYPIFIQTLSSKNNLLAKL